MPRRVHIDRRRMVPEAKYQNLTISKIINRIMICGKKSTAERVVYGALDIVERQEKKDPLTVLEAAIKNASPLLEVKPRRVGGATYQVPVEVPVERGQSLAIRWLLASAKQRSGKSLAERLAAEFTEASKGQGPTIKKREDTHKMAEANRAFAHYRW